MRADRGMESEKSTTVISREPSTGQSEVGGVRVWSKRKDSDILE